jgi:hypothetical protein
LAFLSPDATSDFPIGVTEINGQIAMEKRDGTIYYLHDHLPSVSPPREKIVSFRMFTSQMIVNGTVKTEEDRCRRWNEWAM